MAVDLTGQKRMNLQKWSKTSRTGPMFLEKMNCTSPDASDSQGRNQDPRPRKKDILLTQKESSRCSSIIINGRVWERNSC